MIRRLLCIIFSCLALAAPAADRPNILWITVEDMSATLGCWGDDYADTPHVDRLAEEGVRYTNTFATAPVCSPSRSCLITGLYAQTMGTHQMRSDFAIPESIKAWPSFLRAAGYYTTNNVKTDYNTGSEARLIEEAWDESSAGAHWRHRPDKEQPFFAVFNDMTTHQSRSMTWSYAKFQGEVQSRLPAERIHGPAAAPVPPYYPDTPIVRQTIARHYDCVSVMDDNTGAILKQLKDDGLAEDTIVFYYADHGAGLPRHKRVLHDSGMHVPMIVRFPEKFRHLASADPGKTVEDLVSFVDFPPTILSLLGLEIPEYMQGLPFLGGAKSAEPRKIVYGARDRIDEVFDFSRSVRDKNFLYIRNYMPHFGWNQRSVYPDQSDIRHEFYGVKRSSMTSAQRAFAGPIRPREELYDVRIDPHQITNLAADVSHAETLENMRATLIDQAMELRDLGYLPESDQVNLTRDAAISYDLGKDRAKVPLKKLVDQVEANFAPAAREEGALVKLLSSEQPFLVMQAARDLELRGNLSSKARRSVEATLKTWRGRKDTSLALFIRFSCESILGIKTEY
jgi:N-sulfoglucosamine sulfohydrolase